MADHRRKHFTCRKWLRQRNTFHNFFFCFLQSILIMNIVDDLCHSIKTFRRRNTGCHQSTHCPRELRTGGFDSQLTEERDFHFYVINLQPSLLSTVNQAIDYHHGYDNRKDHIPVPRRPFADIHNTHRQCRHLDINICKHINKDRDYVQKHDRNHTDDRTDQNDRINRRLTDRRL